MRSLRIAFLALGTIAVALMAAGRVNAFLQTQRAQIAVHIVVDVTPAVAYVPGARPDRIDARMALRARGSARLVDSFSGGPLVIGQSQQSAVRVQAIVSPNPTATLLYWNVPTYPISQVAGTTATYSCAYTITVDTAATRSWTLKDGLSADFISSSAWSGTTLYNNTYLQSGAPQPAATPFVVYPDNNNTWNTKEVTSGMQTYCVSLTLTIPVSVPGGTYGTDAVYTLYY